LPIRKGVERFERSVGIVAIDGVQRIVRVDLVDGVNGIVGAYIPHFV
jgi:hydrogenase maturation factor